MDSYDFITHYNYLYNCHPMNLYMEVSLISSLPLQKNSTSTDADTDIDTDTVPFNKICRPPLATLQTDFANQLSNVT